MPDVILDTLLDTAKLVPFLYLAYFFMELLEHRSGDAAARWLRRSGKVGPLVGGVFGIMPQCGFSAAASGLYTGRVITTGTLVAVYLATSDEMLPILLSRGASLGLIFRILGTKLVIGVAVGFITDAVCTAFSRKKGNAREPRIEEVCEREKCSCNDHFALSALKHTLRITVFILIFNFLMNLAVYLIGEDTLRGAVLGKPVLGNLLAALVGVIPNCASSVVLTDLFLDGIVSAGALFSGLLVNAGVGLAVLFRNNRPLRDSFRILGILLAVGISVGILFDLTPIGGWF